MAENSLFDAVIIGGGAAGLMCAIAAGQRGRKVLVIEHANRCGKKILMSGGGRCNFTNTGTTPANYLSNNPHFCKSALARYTPQHFIDMVERHGIAYHEKELGNYSATIRPSRLSKCCWTNANGQAFGSTHPVRWTASVRRAIRS